MKAKLMILLGCLFMSTYTYACGDSCNQPSGCATVDKCQCTDPNYDSNPCMSVSEFCQAFGNISGLDNDL